MRKLHFQLEVKLYFKKDQVTFKSLEVILNVFEMRSAVTAAVGQSGGAVSFSDEIICLMTLMGKLD